LRENIGSFLIEPAGHMPSRPGSLVSGLGFITRLDLADDMPPAYDHH
jgi:hypothetical protein